MSDTNSIDPSVGRALDRIAGARITAKHTPGPFTRRGQRVEGPHGVGVAWCGESTTASSHGSYHVDEREAEANAALFAAAPDLLDVAKGLRLHLKLFCGPDDAIANEVFSIAEAAIRKAEGG